MSKSVVKESGGSKREERVDFRTTSQAKELIQQAARRTGVSMADFILQIVLPEAERIAGEKSQVLISAEDFDRFYHQLDRAPQTLPNIRKLAEKGSPFISTSR